MKGFDYRSHARDGIHLILMKSFSSARALHQGLGRTGRGNERYRRFALSRTKLVKEDCTHLRLS